MPVRVAESSTPSQVSGFSFLSKSPFFGLYMQFNLIPAVKFSIFLLLCSIYLFNYEGTNSGDTSPPACTLLSVGQVSEISPFLISWDF